MLARLKYISQHPFSYMDLGKRSYSGESWKQ